MPQIIPIKDLRDTNKISELCSTSNEPIFVTKNGYGDMVVMSMKTYEEKLARIEMYESILAGIENAKKERLHDGRLTLAELKVKYGE
ncbi:MAG: type II toxin-antitoxin system Phd/YefM family antitoxin [Anaeroplasmataceae bacterium]|nr:type II toxin-antitoxin system Phd/YefM family antitoxin [Anaeroplasmataceae bacterium]